MPQFDGARVIQSLVVAATVGSGFNVGEGVQLATFDHISTNFPSAPILAQTVVLPGRARLVPGPAVEHVHQALVSDAIALLQHQVLHLQVVGHVVQGIVSDIVAAGEVQTGQFAQRQGNVLH